MDGLVVGDVGGGAEEAGGGDSFDLIGGGGGTGLIVDELVAGELFEEEAVDGLVRVEGLDDVVAVLPEGLALGVTGVAASVAVAGDIEPVAAPMFAVAEAGEEAVDDGFVSVGGGVGEEGGGVGGGGRQAG